MYGILLCSGVEVIVDVEERVLWWCWSDVGCMRSCYVVVWK